MGDCPPFAITQSRAVPKKGDQCTVSMAPSLSVGCTFSVTLDGKTVISGDKVGDFELIGMSGAGTASFQALTDDPKGGQVEFWIKCEGPPPCGPTASTNALQLGSYKPSLSYYVLEGLKTIGLVLSVPFLSIAMANWGLCELLCWIYNLAFPNRPCNCAQAKQFVKEIYGSLPDWLKDLLR
jgi:hypothetical protein